MISIRQTEQNATRRRTSLSKPRNQRANNERESTKNHTHVYPSEYKPISASTPSEPLFRLNCLQN